MFTGRCVTGCMNGHEFYVLVRKDKVRAIYREIPKKPNPVLSGKPGKPLKGLNCPTCGGSLHDWLPLSLIQKRKI